MPEVTSLVALDDHRMYHEGLGNVTPDDVHFGQQKGMLSRRQELEAKTLARRRCWNREEPRLKEPDRTERTSLTPRACLRHLR
jgi:hypothetical protein